MRELCREAVDAALAAGATYADARAVLRRGQRVATKNGRVDVVVDDAGAEEWTLGLRVPSWSADARVAVNGAQVPLERDRRGYVPVRRR
jgi:DUF1680 family protein